MASALPPRHPGAVRSSALSNPYLMLPVLSMALPLLWLVRLLALAATAVTGWLTLQKWLHPRLPLSGCGGSEGCATILDSRWSLWFAVPVTLLAATIWLAVLLLTLPAAERWLGRTCGQLLAACGVLLLSGALWFGFLMAVVVRAWCPWCAALHVTALVVGGILLHSCWKASREGESGLFQVAGQTGVAGVALLVIGQVFGKAPDTHVVTAEPPVVLTEAAPEPARPGGVNFLDGTLVLSRREDPAIGSPGALHVLAGLSDYTCPACRAQHADLQALLNADPRSYAVLILPTPLQRSCNPHLPPNARDHPNACVLASLALAFWKAAPDRFPDFHDFLMTSPLPLEPATAKAEADRLVPGIVLDPESPWIAGRLSRNVEMWHQLSQENSKLPKLLLRNDIVLHGSTVSRERFLEIIRETLVPAAPPTETVPVSLLPR